MSHAQRIALIEELSKRKNFHVDYTADNRRWFVDKVMGVFEAQVPSLTSLQIEEKTRATVRDSKSLVARMADFESGLSTNPAQKATKRKARPEGVSLFVRPGFP